MTSGKGYFTGSPTPTEMLRYSYGYALPRRGITRNDGTDNVGFSRLTDGDLNTFWKSNPYLTQHFTGESDALHPQWVVIDLAQIQQVDSIRIAWAEPYARHFVVQYWTGEDPIKAVTRGVWQTFPQGTVSDGKGKTETIRLSNSPMPARFLRIWMTESSNTCDADGAAIRNPDPRIAWVMPFANSILERPRRMARFMTFFGIRRIRSRRRPIARRSIRGISRRIWDRPSRRRWDSICSLPAALRVACLQ